VNDTMNKLVFKLFDVPASTQPSFTETIPGRFITSWDVDLRNSGVGFDCTGILPISSINTLI